MDRLTTRLPDGAYAADGHDTAEVLAALGKFEDLYESVAAESELVRLNMEALSAAGQAGSATCAMLMGSRYLLEEMQSRLDEPAGDVAGRLAALRRQLEAPGTPEDDGFRDAE